MTSASSVDWPIRVRQRGRSPLPCKVCASFVSISREALSRSTKRVVRSAKCAAPSIPNTCAKSSSSSKRPIAIRPPLARPSAIASYREPACSVAAALREGPHSRVRLGLCLQLSLLEDHDELGDNELVLCAAYFGFDVDKSGQVDDADFDILVAHDLAVRQEFLVALPRL